MSARWEGVNALFGGRPAASPVRGPFASPRARAPAAVSPAAPPVLPLSPVDTSPCAMVFSPGFPSFPSGGRRPGPPAPPMRRGNRGNRGIARSVSLLGGHSAGAPRGNPDRRAPPAASRRRVPTAPRPGSAARTRYHAGPLDGETPPRPRRLPLYFPCCRWTQALVLWSFPPVSPVSPAAAVPRTAATPLAASRRRVPTAPRPVRQTPAPTATRDPLATAPSVHPADARCAPRPSPQITPSAWFRASFASQG